MVFLYKISIANIFFLFQINKQYVVEHKNPIVQ